MKIDYEIWAESYNKGMAIYMADEFGQEHFVMTHKENSDLFRLLKNGTTISNLYLYKPSKNKRVQKNYKTVRFIIRVANWVVINELAA